MAPERFDGRSDPRSDVYGLGATLYELLTLRPPFEETDRVRLIERVLRGSPERPSKGGAHVAARPGDDRPQGPVARPCVPLRDGRPDGRGPAPLPGRPADPGAAGHGHRAGAAVVSAEPRPGRRQRPGLRRTGRRGVDPGRQQCPHQRPERGPSPGPAGEGRGPQGPDAGPGRQGGGPRRRPPRGTTGQSERGACRGAGTAGPRPGAARAAAVLRLPGEPRRAGPGG